MQYLKMGKDVQILGFNWETINVKNINNDNNVFHILYNLNILSWIVLVFVSSIYIFFFSWNSYVNYWGFLLFLQSLHPFTYYSTDCKTFDYYTLEYSEFTF